MPACIIVGMHDCFGASQMPNPDMTPMLEAMYQKEVSKVAWSLLRYLHAPDLDHVIAVGYLQMHTCMPGFKSYHQNADKRSKVHHLELTKVAASIIVAAHYLHEPRPSCIAQHIQHRVKVIYKLR